MIPKHELGRGEGVISPGSFYLDPLLSFGQSWLGLRGVSQGLARLLHPLAAGTGHLQRRAASLPQRRHHQGGWAPTNGALLAGGEKKKPEAAVASSQPRAGRRQEEGTACSPA